MTNEYQLSILRHSCSHIMADAVKQLFGDVKLAIGPSIEDGFYYDFLKKEPFTPEDLDNISRKMKEIINSDLPFKQYNKSRKEAIKYFEERNEKFKIEIIDDLPDEMLSFYQHGDFVDLCKGPHVKYTNEVEHFKLLSVAGAYWRGDEKRDKLQRIYGTAFSTKEELDEHIEHFEEAKKRDHRKLGKDLDLFSIHQEEAGPGLIYWHPKGALIRKLIIDFNQDELLKAGYQLVSIPHVAKVDLWKTSGHWDFYRENMYSPMEVEGSDYIVKPMNCPGHILIYKTQIRSYRDMPIRFAEFGTVYRYERSGVLHGLMRVRGFTQDDAHIFCRPEELEDELRKLFNFVLYILKTFGFDSYEVYLSTRPEKYVGSLDIWDRATDALKDALNKSGLDYEVAEGEGVFYGPKVDIKIKDSLGRAWQCSTIQVDFNLPERFDVTYIGEDGKEHQAIMIHRALMGSLERFFGVLIEHYGGAFPVWLAPVQARVLPITDKQNEYALKVAEALSDAGVRVEAKLENEKLSYKIRQAQLVKIPYMLIIGKKELESGTVTVRKRSGEDLGALKIEEFLGMITEQIQKKTIG